MGPKEVNYCLTLYIDQFAQSKVKQFCLFVCQFASLFSEIQTFTGLMIALPGKNIVNQKKVTDKKYKTKKRCVHKRNVFFLSGFHAIFY